MVTQQLVFEGSKRRATGDMDDEFLQLVNTAHDLFAKSPDLTEAVFWYVLPLSFRKFARAQLSPPGGGRR